jgi:hyperosmotically inducible periplasmic protein
MKNMKTFTALTVSLCFFFVLCSCQTPAGRTAGQVVDDATITTKVKAKLLKDSIMSGFAISVQTFEGDVTLTGAVTSEEIKQRATMLTNSVLGVQKVHNLIKVKK